MRALPLLVLLACSGKDSTNGTVDESPTSAGDTDTDIDSDTDSDADADADTDTVAPPLHECAVDRWNPADFTTVIDVGPTYPAATPSEVPWESIAADTLVRIWPRATPYHDKWAIDVAGTEAHPIVVIGVCDPVSGALPVIDGAGAVTRVEDGFENDRRGIVQIGGTFAGVDVVPAYVYVEDLEIRGAHAANDFIDDDGIDRNYDDNAAAIYVGEGIHLTLRGNNLTDCGNGLFAEHETRDLLVSSNHIWNNGNVGSSDEHNTYTEALGVTFEYNRFGPLCEGCDGNNLEDRSAGTVIRYNWIEGGNHELDVVESNDSQIRDDPGYDQTFVYGNVFIERDGDGSSQIANYGGDRGDDSIYRRGTLFFYHNTVVSEWVGDTTLVSLSDEFEKADVRNTIVFAAGNLAILARHGQATLSTSWLEAGWSDSFEGGAFDGVVTDSGDNTTGSDPGFVDRPGQDYTLVAGAAPVDAGGAIAPESASYAADFEYVPHQLGEARPVHSAPDQGAFER